MDLACNDTSLITFSYRLWPEEAEKESLEQRDPRSEDRHPGHAHRDPSRANSGPGTSLYR